MNNATRTTLATLAQTDIDTIASLIKQGYGASGIRNETTYSLKQINAVFKLEAERKASKPFWQVHWEATDIPNIARD